MLARILRRTESRAGRILPQIIINLNSHSDLTAPQTTTTTTITSSRSFGNNNHYDPHVFDEHNTIVGAYTPVTKQLWQQRYKWDTESLAAAQPQTVFHPKPSTPNEVLYPFSKDAALREHFRNPWNSIRIGLILEDCDSMAGFTAYQHAFDADTSNNPSLRPPLLVTATVETIHVNRKLDLFQDMRMSGRVVWTGSSSMDILIEVRQGMTNSSSSSSTEPPNISALFTFVGRDALNGSPQRINPVVPVDSTGKELFATRQAVADARKAARVAQGSTGRRMSAEQVVWADALLAQALLKKDLPALTDPGALLMPQTALENTFTTQPQQRNIHGRIFGGFLMRRAFELAHSTCHLLTACRPRTVLVDEIQFKRPVDVGDLVRFRSRVLRAWNAPTDENPERGLVHVQVAASVVRPEVVESYESNTFNFLFAVDRRKASGGAVLEMHKILPTTEEQAHEVCAFYGPGSEARRSRWKSSSEKIN